MQQSILQLVLLTEHASRTEAVKYVAADKGWNLLTFNGRANPIEALRGQQVDVVVVDLDLPNAVALLSQLNHQLPKVPLLALATQHHVVELQDAELAGAMDFLAFPINPQHFFATIERARQHFFATVERIRQVSSTSPTPDTSPQIIALVSLKGGIGRSTLAANLAVALHRRQTVNVILAEAHHTLGQLPLILNIHPRHTLANLANDPNIDVDLVRGYLQPHQSGIRLLAAPTEPTQVLELPEGIWQQTLSLLSKLAPYVIVDTAATADSVLAQVIAQAHEILLITDPTITGLSNARAMLETLHTQQDLQARVRVVLNRSDLGGGLNRGTLEKHLGVKIDMSVPFEPGITTLACNRGVPFVVSHPQAQISRCIYQLADQLTLQTPTAHRQESRGMGSILSFFTRN